jgi:hypothetical protein
LLYVIEGQALQVSQLQTSFLTFCLLLDDNTIGSFSLLTDFAAESTNGITEAIQQSQSHSPYRIPYVA